MQAILRTISGKLAYLFALMMVVCRFQVLFVRVSFLSTLSLSPPSY